MKSSVRILPKSIVFVIILVLASCHSNKSENLKQPTQENSPKQVAKDTCCNLRYPASQIGVAGSDLFNLNFTMVPTGTAGAPYKVQFTPTTNFEVTSQAYMDYVKAIYPCATGIGTMIVICQGGLGGHTQRRMVDPRYINFSPGTTSSPYYILNDPSVWDSYYENPTPLPSTENYGTAYGLQPNVIYGVEYGLWIDGCTLTEKEKECLWYHNYQKFRWQSPQFLKKGENYIILETLDSNNKIIESRKVSVQEEKQTALTPQ